MTGEKLVERIGELLEVDHDLGFLIALEKDDLITLVALIRDRVDRMSG